MRYYSPKWVAVVGMIASIVAAFSLPLFGYILSNYVFILSLDTTEGPDLEYYEYERDKWTWAFIGLVFGIGISAFI